MKGGGGEGTGEEEEEEKKRRKKKKGSKRGVNTSKGSQRCQENYNISIDATKLLLVFLH